MRASKVVRVVLDAIWRQAKQAWCCLLLLKSLVAMCSVGAKVLGWRQRGVVGLARPRDSLDNVGAGHP